MKNTSISRLKNFKHCPLSYLYTYVDKFTPVEKQPIWVQTKGLVLHETFEALTIIENYNGTGEFNDTPLKEGEKFLEPSWWKAFGGKVENGIKHEPIVVAAQTKVREATNEQVMDAFKYAMELNNFPIEKAIEYNLKKGLKRWLSFKHDYLDKRGTTLYAEKRYDEVLFGETKTTTILDLLEDLGDGNYIIYDYKTPKSVDVERYKEQLILYAYTMACVKGLIKPVDTNPQSIKTSYTGAICDGVARSDLAVLTTETLVVGNEFEQVAKHFKLFVFFPLVDLKTDSYEKCLREVPFTAEDVAEVLADVKKTCDIIDGYDFSRPAEVLQLSNPNFQCKWCAFCGAKPQPDTLSEGGRPFEGCPITAFVGMAPTNSEFEPVLKKPI